MPDAFSLAHYSYPSSILDMELELSLGDSRAPAKSTFTPALTPIHAGEGEGHELALELGVGTAKRAEQDNQKTLVQAEDVQEEEEETRSYSESPVELSLICPLLPASAEIGTEHIICANCMLV